MPLIIAFIFVVVFYLGMAVLPEGGEIEAANPTTSYVEKLYDEGGFDIRAILDPETGCYYLAWKGYEKGGLTVRMNSDGEPMCRKPAVEHEQDYRPADVPSAD